MTYKFSDGAKDSIPIAVGYFSVSFTFGIMAAGMGIDPLICGIISLTNLTSAGQFAGITLISAGAAYIEMFLTQFIINLRYGLMSLSLSQHLSTDVKLWQRFVMAYGITDENFAVAVSKKYPVNFKYMVGLILPSAISWTLGSLAGAFFRNLLPASVQSALGIALYGMFIAIILPPATENKWVAVVSVIAAVCSLMFKFLPLLNRVSGGFVIIICTILASTIGALLFPVDEEEGKA
ncbi:MAG: AzlC family ABC transporter permease [Lachnospiraceae bacterium]|nr:AzlC family ABC transporter permease [Lachnospiraceae bacterium]